MELRALKRACHGEERVTATNFEEFVLPMAEEAPHAVVLDWYRRLELMIRDYVVSRHLSYRNGAEAEHVIANDRLLGTDVATSIQRLRLLRNQVAHRSRALDSSEAVAFARESLDLIGRLWGAKGARTVDDIAAPQCPSSPGSDGRERSLLN